MKKLTLANPDLTYPQRRELIEQFVPQHIRTEAEIAQFFENGERAIADFLQQVRDRYCSNQIYQWA
jgi:acetyl-CoA carboxylase/biotin carboxylase 1